MKNNARKHFDMRVQLQNKRDQCKCYNETSSSNPKESRPLHPDYPFQLTVTDIFHMAGHISISYTLTDILAGQR